MPEKLPQTIKTADPSKFSLVEEALDLELKGTETRPFIFSDVYGKEVRIYVDKATGERFHKISHERVARHKLLVLILKGIINVSDIVKVGNDYYSHEQNFDNILPTEGNVLDEMEADMIILGDVFRDYDHGYFNIHNQNLITTSAKDPGAVLENRNLRVDKDHTKLSFFDFDYFDLDRLLEKGEHLDISELKRKFKNTLRHTQFAPNTNTERILSILKKKVGILLALFEDNEFERFTKIIQKSGIQLKEEGGERILFDNIRLRLQALSIVLSQSLKN